MRLIATLAAVLILGQAAAPADVGIPYAHMQAPVVHAGRYHVLTCGSVSMVLDSERGFAIERLSFGDTAKHELDDTDTVLSDMRITAVLGRWGTLDQAFDPDAGLTIIEQGENRVAARVDFSLRDIDGGEFGHGTLGIVLTRHAIHLLPRIEFDSGQSPVVRSAGIDAAVPGRAAGIIRNGALLMPDTGGRHIPFTDSTSFSVLIDNPGRPSVKIGWLDAGASYPDSLHQPRTIAAGLPIDWRRTPSAGFSARYERNSLTGVGVLWALDDEISAVQGEPLALAGSLTLCLGNDAVEAHRRWNFHADPIAPAGPDNVSWVYNRYEGVYDVMMPADTLELGFDNIDGGIDLDLAVRIPLEDGDMVVAEVNRRRTAVALFTAQPAPADSTGALREDEARSGYAIIGVPVLEGARTQLALARRNGLHMVYRTESEDERYELRSPYDGGVPLGAFSPGNGVLYGLRGPDSPRKPAGRLSLHWTVPDSSLVMNNLRGFRVIENGPDCLRFTWDAVDGSGHGLISATVNAPLEQSALLLDVTSEFTPLVGQHGWNSLEYATVHFETVGVTPDRAVVAAADSIPPGGLPENGGSADTSVRPAAAFPAGFFWLDGAGAFRSRNPADSEIADERARAADKEAPALVDEGLRSGLFWMAGLPDGRGGVFFRLGEHTDSPGAYTGFSASPDFSRVGNYIAGRADSSATETISYTLGLFNDPLPDTADLERMYNEAAPDSGAYPIDDVRLSPDGRITGFVVREE